MYIIWVRLPDNSYAKDLVRFTVNKRFPEVPWYIDKCYFVIGEKENLKSKNAENVYVLNNTSKI